MNRVQVVARIRPLSQTETQQRANNNHHPHATQYPNTNNNNSKHNPIRADPSGKGIVIQQNPGLTDAAAATVLSPTKKELYFEFDRVFDESATQQNVYEGSVGDAISNRLFQGYNTTILAYGQTGSGKTYTMGGGRGAMSNNLLTSTPSSKDGAMDNVNHPTPKQQRDAISTINSPKRVRSGVSSTPPRNARNNDSLRGRHATAASSVRNSLSPRREGLIHAALQRSISTPDVNVNSESCPNKSKEEVNKINDGEVFVEHTGGEEDGVIPRAVHDLFRARARHSGEVNISMSYVEVYNDEIRDLLRVADANADQAVPESSSPLHIRDCKNKGGVEVVGLTTAEVETCEQVMTIIELASLRRTTSSTLSNDASSRSHAICMFNLTISPEIKTNHRLLLDDEFKNDNEQQQQQQQPAALTDILNAKLTLVDLAGSERIKVSGAEGLQQQESIMINKDLLTLGKVISALSKTKKSKKSSKARRRSSGGHVPYRDSKLTRLLKDSLGGNCCTIMVACVSPASVNQEETVNTLRYAQRTRCIDNVAVQNIVRLSMSPSEAAALLRENQMLKTKLLQECSFVQAGASEDEKNRHETEQKELKRKVLQLESQLKASSAECHAASERADRFQSKLTHVKSVAQAAGVPTNVLSPSASKTAHYLDAIASFSAPPSDHQPQKEEREKDSENARLKRELEEMRREREALREELNRQKFSKDETPKRKKLLEIDTGTCENSNVAKSEVVIDGNIPREVFTELSPKTPRSPMNRMTEKSPKLQPRKFSDFKPPESTGAVRTPDQSKLIEIRANAKQLLRLASRAMNKPPAHKSSSAASPLPSIPGSPSVAVAKSTLTKKSLKENCTDASGETLKEDARFIAPPQPERKKVVVCTCKSPMFPPDSEQANFFLPKLEHKCSCGAAALLPTKTPDILLQNNDPTLLSNILRPWQADFLRSMGITTGGQLVETYKRYGKDLSSAMVMWRQNRGYKKARKKSCNIALYIWTRTCKLALRNTAAAALHHVQEQQQHAHNNNMTANIRRVETLLEDCCNQSLDTMNTNTTDVISVCSSLGNDSSACRDRFARIEI